MKYMFRIIYKTIVSIDKGIYKLLIIPFKKSLFAKCGNKVYIGKRDNITYKNTYIGERVFIGSGAIFMSTIAKINIGDNVMFGPNVTIITGNHRVDIIGKYMIDVNDKLEENDTDVIIENDVWIGANTTILKGVTIGEGSIVGAGSVITKNIPPYSIVAGVPGEVLKNRFNKIEIKEHKILINSENRQR